MAHEEWLRKVYAQYKNKVYAYFSGKLNSREEAEDLTSRVFMEVTRCADRFDAAKASESTWIYAICRNLCNRHLRDASSHRKILNINNKSQEEIPCEAGDIERYIQSDLLEKLLSGLTEDKRNIIILSYYYELSPQEISTKLDLSYTNVCAIKSRALKELKEKLKTECERDGTQSVRKIS
jgi:RNA polymerase sigma-70 factor (ECF subfamily)